MTYWGVRSVFRFLSPDRENVMKHGTSGSRADRGRRAPVVAIVVIAFLVVAGTCSRLLAGTGSVQTLPMAGRKAANGRALKNTGLKLTIDTTWVGGSGYRPIHIEVTTWPPVPAVADRTLKIELRTGDWARAEGRLVVSRTLEIPQGSTGVVATVSVPQSQPWNGLKVDVWEDGTWRIFQSIVIRSTAGRECTKSGFTTPSRCRRYW